MNRPSARRLLGALLALAVAIALPHGVEAQQEYTIRGVAVDAATQQPLSGVAVQIRGTQRGTVGDQEGRFRITAALEPGDYEVRITRIGYSAVTRAVTLAAESAVDLGTIAMRESAVELAEIVVTGAGAPTERRRLGNVVESVQGETINQSPAAASIDIALQGRIPGAVISQNHGQPGGGASIRLRGTSSILGGAEPLIVVDGVIVDNNAGALVGLGANATYQGAALQNRLADIAPGDIERVEVIKGAAAAALYGSRANNGVIQIITRQGAAGEPVIRFESRVSAARRPGEVPILMDPRASPGDVFIGQAGSVGDPVERFNWQEDIFQTGWGTANQLSVSGGTDQTRYYVSGRWNTEEGIIRGQANDRVSARTRINQRLGENVEVGVNANFIRNRTDFIPEGEQTQGVYTNLIFTPSSWDPYFNPELGRYPYNPLITVNPFDVIENWRVDSNVDRLVGNFDGSWTPIDALSINYLFGIDHSREENIYLRPPLSQGPAFRGEIQHPMRTINRYNNDITATHAAALSPRMDLTTTLGFRHTSDRTDVVRAAAADLPPQAQTVGGAVQTASQSISEIRTVGSFLQAQLGFGETLTFTGALNVEGSSAFGPDERWQLFPRLGASWVIAEEPWFADGALGNILSSARLRGSYGETGGQPPGAYFRFDNLVTTAYGGRAGLVSSTVAGNPELAPERQREWEGGFEVGFLEDRIGLEFTYYDQYTRDLVLGVPIHLSAGYTTQFQNVGEVSNRGVEIGLNTVPVQTPGFTWRSNLSYSANRNRVERLFGDVDRLPLFGYLNAVIEGQPIGVFWGRVQARDAQGVPIDSVLTIGGETFLSPIRATNPDGSDVLEIIGDPNPDFTLTFSNDFQIGRNLSATMLLDGRFGNDVANFTRRIQEYFGLHPNNLQEIENPEMRGGGIRGYYTLNTHRHLLYEEWIEDGSFVKLREIGVRYRFDDQPWVQTLGARGLELSLAGRNLLTWTNYTGIDPEINLFAANTVARGVEFGTTPVPRTVVFGVNLTF
jgi:TonB-dependent starch-binding outer membrane protein SusC